MTFSSHGCVDSKGDGITKEVMTDDVIPKDELLPLVLTYWQNFGGNSVS